MAVHLPTLKQLQYLVALRQHGHFGRAAEASFVTQSTLSAGLRELETQLGITLVERTRRVVRFTPLGQKIADKALRILREEASQAACDALHRGQLDCVLLAMPYGCGEVDIAYLFDDPLFVAFPAGEAPAPGAVEPSAIDETRLLLLEDGHCLKDHALSACNRPELRAEATMMGTSLHTLVQMVDNGLGQTFVPAMAIESGILEGTRIVARPLRSKYNYRRIALAWRKSSPREEEFQLLAKTLREISREIIPQLAA